MRDRIACLALAGVVVYAALAFGLRSLVQLRRTGSSGFHGVSGRFGSAEWWGGALFVAAALLAGLAPVLQIVGSVAPLEVLDRPALHRVGAVLFAAGLAGTLHAQFAMGDSWRIGVDPGERTALVVLGPYRLVRNPIYTTMFAAIGGLGLMIPNLVALSAFVLLVVAIEIQVRLVEEPHLGRVHGESYRAYCGSVGRFLPGVGVDRAAGAVAPRGERSD
jgi:protein-S-isoprenylcysteine O-methyltransferase Ste14